MAAIPTVPSRTYLTPPVVVQGPPPTVYAPNTAVPKFIRMIALVVFLGGGSVAAAVAWVYRVRGSSRRIGSLGQPLTDEQ